MRTVLVGVLALMSACGGGDEGKLDSATPTVSAPGTPTGGTPPGGTSTGSTATGSTPGTASHPVYVTVAGHIEDDPIYHQDCGRYAEVRGALVQLGASLEGTGVRFHLQASYEWFLGAQLCEDDALRATTDGLNVLDYLATTHGFAIDAHQEGASVEEAESGNNFADIRFLGGEVTTHMSETTGFQWDNPRQYAALQAGEQGLLHPEYTWRPEVLAGGVSMDHTDGDFTGDMTSVGVWIPSDFSEERFHEHDTSDDARMVYVGSGPNQWCDDWKFVPGAPCHFQSTADFVELLVRYKAEARIDADGLYTSTLFVPGPVMFDAAEHAKVLAVVEQLQPLVASGDVAFATFPEVVEVYEASGAVPTILTYDQIHPDDYTCPPPP